MNKKKKAGNPGKPRVANIDLSGMRNEAFFQYCAEALRLLRGKFEDDDPKLGALTEEFARLFARLDEAFKKIPKSALTEKIQEADKARDTAWYGMVEATKNVLKHLNKDIVDAAKRLTILFKTYGRVPIKSFQEETAAICNALQELHGAYATDVALTGISIWVGELQSKNNEFMQLVRDRYDEKGAKTDIAMKAARAELAEQYGLVIEMVNSLAVTEGAARCEQFIKALNLVIEKFNTIKSKKRKAAGNKNEDEDT